MYQLNSTNTVVLASTTFRLTFSIFHALLVRVNKHSENMHPERILRSVTILLVALLTGCSSLPHVVEPVSEDNHVPATTIFITSHGWHTGIIVPSGLIQSRIPQLRQRFSKVTHIEFGWGDRGFYQAKEITSGLTVRAIFWPTETVVHVVAVPSDPRTYFPQSEVIQVCLSGKGYSALVRFIENSFYRDERQKIVKLSDGLYGNAQFYKGVGDYYLFNTCNKWTAKGLKSAGLDISPTF